MSTQKGGHVQRINIIIHIIWFTKVASRIKSINPLITMFAEHPILPPSQRTPGKQHSSSNVSVSLFKEEMRSPSTTLWSPNKAPLQPF